MKVDLLNECRNASRMQFVSSMAIAASILLFNAGSDAVAGDWQVLFDGTGLNGWKASSGNKQFQLVDSVIRGTSSSKTHFLCTEQEYRDFELELEVKLHDTELNSGVQFRTRLTRVNDNGDARPGLHGPQVDLAKSPGRSGHIFGQGNGRWFTPKAALKRNSLMFNGEWNKLRVLAQGKRIQTWINGKPVSDVTFDDDIDKKYPKGVIALQVHGVKSPEKVCHVSFRNIRIREIEN